MFHVPAHKNVNDPAAQVPATPAKIESTDKRWWQQVGHFYRPLRAFGGTVLKYAGVATVGNLQHAKDEWMNDRGIYSAGFKVLDAHLGDRIHATTHTEYKD